MRLLNEPMSISITVNGKARSISQAMSVAALLSELGIEGKKIAVERNLEIVPRSIYTDVTVGEGDRLEIVKIVGGG